MKEAKRMDFLMHYGIPGQRWGVRRFQNEDGTLTPAGKERYSDDFIPLPAPDRSATNASRYTSEYQQSNANTIKRTSGRPSPRPKYVTSNGTGVTVRKETASEQKGAVTSGALGVAGALSSYVAYKKAQSARLPKNYRNQIQISPDIVAGNKTTEYNWLTRDYKGLNMTDVKILDNLGLTASGTGDPLGAITSYAQTQGIDTLTIDTNGYVEGIPYTIFEEFRDDPATMLFPLVPPEVLNSPYRGIRSSPKKHLQPSSVSKKKSIAAAVDANMEKAKKAVKDIAEKHQDNFNLGMDTIVDWLKGLKRR